MSKRRRTISSTFVVLLTGLLMGVAGPSAAYLRPGTTERVSVSSTGAEGRKDQRSLGAGACGEREIDVSEDGRFVAFSYDSSDLVPGDRNLACDVFVRDLREGTTERISVAHDGGEAVGACPFANGQASYSMGPSISADGRYVAFVSCATNLVAGDTNLSADAFVRDREKATTTRVSMTSEGEQLQMDSPGPGTVEMASISDNGRFVAFRSAALNLTLPVPTVGGQIYVRDVKKETTEIVSVSASGEPANDSFNFYPAISGNGRYVVYCSPATNIITPDLNGGTQAYDVFLYDRRTKKPELITVSTDGTQQRTYQLLFNHCGLESGSDDVISDDGRYVTFVSYASNLVANDSNGEAWGVGYATDFFVRDRKAARTERVSVSSTGGEGEKNGSWWSAISGNGRYVMMATESPLDASSQDGGIFVHDRVSGAAALISGSFKAGTYCGEGIAGTFSFAGRYAGFLSRCTEVVEGDTNDAQDAFLRDIGPDLGIGGWSSRRPPASDPPDDRICITPEICLPPGGARTKLDLQDDLPPDLTALGANLYGASLVHRPLEGDLFVRIELERMPHVGPDGNIPDSGAVVYGLSFEADGVRYEARAGSFAGGTFELFRCDSEDAMCVKVADLSGGYGTTGDRIVLSLPLRHIGLENGGHLGVVEAFAGVGSRTTGALSILDSVRLTEG